MEYPACLGTLDFSTGQPVCDGSWVTASSALTIEEASEIAGPMLFVLALAWGFRMARKALGR